MKTGIIFISLLFIFNKVSVQHFLTKEYNAPRATDIIQNMDNVLKNHNIDPNKYIKPARQ